MIALMQTDFPEPVAPAMSRCGIFVRSSITSSPSRFRPSTTGSTRPARRNSALSIRSRTCTSRGVGLGTSMPIAALPGIGATMRSDCARIASARSSASEETRPTFTPRPGSSSNRVTTGPTVLLVICAPTRNVSSVATNRSPICSICTASGSATVIGPSVNNSMGGMSEPGAGGDAGLRGAAGFGLRSLEERETGGGRGSRRLSGTSRRAADSTGSTGSDLSLLPSPVFCRSIVNGCHPTVRIPSADSANKPINTAPALPTALSTPFARKAGNSPTRRSVRVQLA